MSHNNYYRTDVYPWMTDDQFECFELLCTLVGGAHHLMGTVKKFGRGVEINTTNHGWCTYDFNLLTRAVVLSHDRMIRLEIQPSGPGRLKIVLSKRHTREGDMSTRIPTIEDHIVAIREWEKRA